MLSRKLIVSYALGMIAGIAFLSVLQADFSSRSDFNGRQLEIRRRALHTEGWDAHGRTLQVDQLQQQADQLQADQLQADQLQADQLQLQDYILLDEHDAKPISREAKNTRSKALTAEEPPKLRLLCWILTSPANHETRAKHVLATWGKRCEKIILMSSEADEALGAIDVIQGNESRSRLYEKSKAAFRYVYEHHLNDADWILKADDDTYVIVENLRFFLNAFNSSAPLYFGRRLYSHSHKVDYMSGGAGYVLSREALKRLVEIGLSSETCRQDAGGSEDLELGRCLKNAGVHMGDSRDAEGRERFFPLNATRHVVPLPRSSWLWRFNHYHMIDGLKGLSDTAVSFHYISSDKMYELEYLLYHLRPHGLQREDLLQPSLSPQNDELPREVFRQAPPMTTT